MEKTFLPLTGCIWLKNEVSGELVCIADLLTFCKAKRLDFFAMRRLAVLGTRRDFRGWRRAEEGEVARAREEDAK